MFEDYLQDSFEFLASAEKFTKDSQEREARRYFRASVFYAFGAIEAFVNYIGESFAQAQNLPQHETLFLNDKALVFIPAQGFKEKSEYHKVEDKIRLLMQKFVPSFEFNSSIWCSFKEFKTFRDSLVHSRQIDDETTLTDYQQMGRKGLRAIITIMNEISKGMYKKPLRNQILDLIPN